MSSPTKNQRLIFAIAVSAAILALNIIITLNGTANIFYTSVCDCFPAKISVQLLPTCQLD